MKTIIMILNLFRVKEWYDSKIPMLISASYYLFVRYHVPFSPNSLFLLAVLICFYSLFMAFGYIINDYADMEVDKLAGKHKVMHSMSAKMALFIVIFTGIAGCLTVLVYRFDLIVLLLLTVIYFLGASYSAPPFRFKEKGVMGLIVSSSAQRCMPLLLVFVLQNTGFDIWLVFWIVLSFLVGLRYILVHQYIDIENDRKSGVRTFTLKNEKITIALIPFVFITEIILNILLLIPVIKENLWLIIVLSFYLLLSIIRWRGVKIVFGQKPLYTYQQMPLEDFYNHYMPLLLSIIMTIYDVRWGFLIAVWAVFLAVTTVVHMSFPITFLIRSFKYRKKK